MKKVSFAIDLVFINFCFFLLFFAITQFFIVKNIALVVSLTLTLLFSLVFVKISIDKNKKKEQKSSLSKLKKETLLQFKFLSKSDVISTFIKAFKSKGYSPVKKKKYIYLPERNTLISVKLGFEKVTKTDIVAIYNELNKNDVAMFISCDYDDDISAFASRFDGRIVLTDFVFAFNLLYDTDCLPKISVKLKEENAKKKANLKSLLYKKHAKKFFFFGAYFLLFSFFVTLKFYYIICGCVFLIFAIYLRLFGKAETKSSVL